VFGVAVPGVALELKFGVVVAVGVLAGGSLGAGGGVLADDPGLGGGVLAGDPGLGGGVLAGGPLGAGCGEEPLDAAGGARLAMAGDNAASSACGESAGALASELCGPGPIAAPIAMPAANSTPASAALTLAEGRRGLRPGVAGPAGWFVAVVWDRVVMLGAGL
jgi:hypothetical protein